MNHWSFVLRFHDSEKWISRSPKGKGFVLAWGILEKHVPFVRSSENFCPGTHCHSHYAEGKPAWWRRRLVFGDDMEVRCDPLQTGRSCDRQSDENLPLSDSVANCCSCWIPAHQHGPMSPTLSSVCWNRPPFWWSRAHTGDSDLPCRSSRSSSRGTRWLGWSVEGCSLSVSAKR